MNPSTSRAALQGTRLYGILDLGYLTPADLIPATQQLLTGGAQILQLRAKSHPTSAIAAWAKEILPLCQQAAVPFIINDHPEVAREVGADGVHVGQDDQNVLDVREIVGPEAIIGLSTHSLAQLKAADLLAQQHPGVGPDYLGFGPLFPTPTKPDYLPIGTEEVAQIPDLTPLPVFCIGGIKLANLPQVLAAGALRVVIVSDLLTAPDRQQQTAACRRLLTMAM